MKGRIISAIIGSIIFLTFPSLAHQEPTFEQFLKNFEQKALKEGITRATYQSAMANIKIEQNIKSLVQKQPEFTTPIWDYIGKRVSNSRIKRGKLAMAKNRELFAKIENKFGVDKAILAAIWGIESDYGAVLNNKSLIKPIIPSLATLVYLRRSRVEQDEKALIAALRLIQDFGYNKNNLVGSWAGAIGHTQIISSALVKYATDGDKDGKIDPHNSLADALATSAKYLRSMGYQPGLDWGFEVELPKDFDYSLSGREKLRPISFFKNRGVKRVANRKFSNLDILVFLYVPAGKDGPKFLMTQNYLVLKSYNFSDSYALSVAHLADRLKGSPPLIASWPTNTKFPNLEQRKKIQIWLKQLGYYHGEIDARLGPISAKAYQQFQKDNNMIADGFITLNSYYLLQRRSQ